MTFGPSVRYPAGPITTHGAYELLNNRVPHVALRAYDDSIVFNLMGPLALCDRTRPERVELKDIKGLVAPWKLIDQKGASQDGVTFVDALYEPIEIELGVNCVGRDQSHLRKVVNHLVSSIDIKQEAELSWFTHEMGRWWAPVRWHRPVDDQIGGVSTRSQKMVLKLRCDSGFWQSYPNVDQFRFTYDDVTDDFAFLTAPGDPITGWTTEYSGAGSGVLYTDGDQAVSTLQSGKTVVARRTSYTTSDDNMVVAIQLGTLSSPTFDANTYVDIWARMNNTGTAGQDGIRCRIGATGITLSSFDGGVETLIRQQDFGGTWWWWWYIQNPPPAPGETWSLACGVDGDSRTYKVMRNNATVLTAKEGGTTSLLGSGYRKVGFGQSNTSGSVRPIGVRDFKAGTDSTTAQSGYLQRINVGDQPMWDRYTCFGPGIFYIANGPGSQDMVKFGPLLPGQVMQIRTDPRKRGVVDMSAKPVSAQTAAEWNKAVADYKSFLSVGGMAPNDSVFGVLTPQGNPYTLMKGRFSVPIPPRSPGGNLDPYHIAVSIDNGNSDSQIIAAGTPLRRMPY